MASNLIHKKANFGTAPVFFTALSTILGAILFLRFGWAVGNVGFLGILGIILLGHLISIPTAMAVAEIATNQKVQGGGAYYIISRSFGMNIGGAVGITLYLSQAISIAFYVIAFSEAFEPILSFINQEIGILIPKKIIALISMGLLSYIILTKGANVGMKALYGVVAVLASSLVLFFLGHREGPAAHIDLFSKVTDSQPFFYVFAVIFPAFTGLAAGLGLSGDLKNPKKSIPRGTIWATIVGLVVYVLIAYKLSISASPDELASDQLIMSKIALWGPIIPIGLAAASISSALGSVMVAPRTLQAIAVDEVFPNARLNKWLGYGKEGSNEPIWSTWVSVIIAFFFVAIGDINFVAEIIAMFFMVTYGAICLISFLEHFAADPAYRPTFKSKWYISLIGAVLSFWIMFKMNSLYAILSLVVMAIIYIYISAKNKESKGLGNLFKGVAFQLSRQLQVFMQRTDPKDKRENWRPFIMCISKDSFKRSSALDLIRWISHKYGFGTYIHFIKGMLTKDTNKKSREVLDRLMNLPNSSKCKVYMDTIISPSYTSAIAQTIQLQGISGKGNNMILLEFSRTDPGDFPEALMNFDLLKSTHLDVCVLNTSHKGFGNHKEVHIWITSQDYENANLMILMAFILLGHPEWRKSIIKIFALYPMEKLDEQRKNLLKLIATGRLPISPGNIELIPQEENQNYKAIIEQKSIDADLSIIGFRDKDISKGIDLFNGFGEIGNILFVNADKQKEIF
ncbi:MAG: amino acid permease [Bacteroidota bacterium]|nr:amino acid permease [Bacteroidota bacterium]